MHHHGPSCLPGPVPRKRHRWHPPAPQRPDEPPIRRDLVERVRREIEAGTYETPEKLERALERLLERLEEGSE